MSDTTKVTAVHITDDQFDEQVLKSNIPVLVDFFAVWCGPCKMAAPILDELADTYKGKVKIVKIDVDQSELAGKYGVMSIPTVVVFKDGKEVEEAPQKPLRKVGFGGRDGYEEMIKKVTS
ncbi:thioredoxin [Candidatus Cerribacteria bacterium 'Amazon FNV 2010 28 9']|uniref:Thioredoxin n=1 Tax=Candidatus Cerribacteria bacterium 'Amazon FNV 2010 28 9' TaxID=2081795 RepID=A0A317JQS5_9BACT|nr:MAG: thioredoxin [Candidatus Cerribacteria bacterium 'Amazon FNV 2010 28 9']